MAGWILTAVAGMGVPVETRMGAGVAVETSVETGLGCRVRGVAVLMRARAVLVRLAFFCLFNLPAGLRNAELT